MKTYTKWSDVPATMKTKTQWNKCGRKIKTEANEVAVYDGRDGLHKLYFMSSTIEKQTSIETEWKQFAKGNIVALEAIGFGPK